MGVMRGALRDLVNRTLKPFDVCAINLSYLEQLAQTNQLNCRAVDDLRLLCALPERHAAPLLKMLCNSNSQLRQDLFVLSALDFKRNGFFVEFGATNGIFLSNTLLLEKEFGWTGILAEPARCWHAELKKNRKAHIETDCLWRDSNSILTFNEVEERELSTISSFSSSDHHREARKAGRPYEVRTISLVELLRKYNAPRYIDYLSIDTEGSEYEILKHFDFDQYRFQVITCEHNFQGEREKIHSLLTGKGYIRKLEELSQFDDWYVMSN